MTTNYSVRTLLASISVITAMVVTCVLPESTHAVENPFNVLQALPTAQAVPSGYTYSRDAFGWNTHDTNSNGCRTRDDILARDLDNIELSSDGCTVLSGTLHDPYTGTTIQFQRGQGTSNAVQIDHIVALHDAWQSGAYRWTNAKKQLYANDPYVLAAVDGPANQEKSDSAIQYWMPTNSEARCAYALAQIGIKHKYELSVTEAERTQLNTVLRSCPASELKIPADTSGTSLVRTVQKAGRSTTQELTGFPFVDLGVGSNDGKKYEFRGMNAVTRQDMAAFLYRWAGKPAYTPSAADKKRFTDVTASTPHHNEIWWLAHEGISEGWCKGNTCEFRGMASVTRQDMAAFMHRLVGDYGPAERAEYATITFKDVNNSTPHNQDIMWLARTGITQGWGSGSNREFRGSKAVVRQDMAAFLYRLAGSPASKESTNTWVRSRYVDVNEGTSHVHEIYWLTLQQISEGWVYTPPTKPRTTSKPTQPSTVYYKNCAAVRAAGKAPLYKGQPGYREALDRDRDGAACE